MAVFLRHASGQLANSAGAILTADAGTTLRIISAVFTNNDSSSRTMDLHLVPASGSATAANRLVNDRAVAVDERWNCAELVNQVIPPGGTLQGLASAATAISYFISYQLITS